MESASPARARATFREAGQDDVARIVALVESAYRGDSSRTGWTTEADLLDGQRTDPEAVRALLTADGSLVLLAERDGSLVACCHLERRGETAYFGMFAVSPAEQNSGLGRTVLAEAERVARARWAAREMQMTVITLRTELVAWYERRGYRATGEIRPFPYADERFGRPRRDDLDFSVLVKPLG
ncbi:GNAT family N-acetyltransferase [Actinocorallia sp. A-T 12471]|nr:GNAT family N-acetyltransferase [Actinocorallia sp. A-T 12471]MDX6741085.1 GNAT family N-acetyltransferase [Actinocorallia sp. A-T 12471]